MAFAMLLCRHYDAAEVAVSCHSAIVCFRLHRVAAVVCKQNIFCFGATFIKMQYIRSLILSYNARPSFVFSLFDFIRG